MFKHTPSHHSTHLNCIVLAAMPQYLAIHLRLSTVDGPVMPPPEGAGTGILKGYAQITMLMNGSPTRSEVDLHTTSTSLSFSTDRFAKNKERATVRLVRASKKETLAIPSPIHIVAKQCALLHDQNHRAEEQMW